MTPEEQTSINQAMARFNEFHRDWRRATGRRSLMIGLLGGWSAGFMCANALWYWVMP